jgi:hypothetical protein
MRLTQKDEVILNEKVNPLLFDRRPQLPHTLYHYTTAQGLLGIVEEQKLWATHYAYLNDPSEVEYGRELIMEALKDKRSLMIQHPDKEASRWMQFCEAAELAVRLAHGQLSDHFLACFCEEGDLLSQWRGYGSRCGGYSLGFTAQALDSLEVDGIRVIAVKYDREEQKRIISEILDAVFEQMVPSLDASGPLSDFKQLFINALAPHLIDCLCSFKNPAFKEEREWRCVFPTGIGSVTWERKNVFFRQGDHGIVPYVKIALSEDGRLPIAEIIAGPGLDRRLAEKALALLDQKYELHVPVRGSQFSLR